MDNMSKAFFQNIGIDAVVIPSDNSPKSKTKEEKKKDEFESALLQGLLEAFETEVKSAQPVHKQVTGPVTVGKALSEEHKRRMIAHA